MEYCRFSLKWQSLPLGQWERPWNHRLIRSWLRLPAFTKTESSWLISVSPTKISGFKIGFAIYYPSSESDLHHKKWPLRKMLHIGQTSFSAPRTSAYRVCLHLNGYGGNTWRLAVHANPPRSRFKKFRLGDNNNFEEAVIWDRVLEDSALLFRTAMAMPSCRHGALSYIVWTS